ncbi:MAG: hypothetical protein ACK5LZ_04790 [Anaerorhabdus sp.]
MEELTAVVPQNYKSGKYIAGLYKKSDFGILVVVSLIGFITVFAIGLSNTLVLFLGVGIVCATFVIMIPIKQYQAVYRYILIWISFKRKEKDYRYGGIGEIYKK